MAFGEAVMVTESDDSLLFEVDGAKVYRKAYAVMIQVCHMVRPHPTGQC